MPTYKISDPSGVEHSIEGPEGASREDVIKAVQHRIENPVLEPDFSVGELASRGVKRGTERLKSTFTDVIPAMAGSALGFDEYAQEQLGEAAQKQAVIDQTLAPQYRSFREIDSVADAGKFAVETIAEQIPNLFEAVATGLGGGAVAKKLLVSSYGKKLMAEAAAKKLKGAAAEKFVTNGLQSAGQLGGVFLGSYALNAPEVFQNIYQETGEIEPAVALIYGSAAAALDSILPAAVTRNLSGPMKAGIVENLLSKSGMNRGVLKKTTAGLLKGVASEGVTEGAQEGISIAAERFVDDNPDVFGSAEWERIMESSVRGAVAGGGFGIAGGAVEGGREGAQRAQRLADIEEARSLRAQMRDRQTRGEFSEQGDMFGEDPNLEPVEPTPEVTAPVAETATEQPDKFEQERVAIRAERAEAAKEAAGGLDPNQEDFGFAMPKVKKGKKGEAKVRQPAEPVEVNPQAAPLVVPTELSKTKAFLAGIGVPYTPKVERAIRGKNLLDPDQRNEVIAALEVYANNTQSKNGKLIRENVEIFVDMLNQQAPITKPEQATVPVEEAGPVVSPAPELAVAPTEEVIEKTVTPAKAKAKLEEKTKPRLLAEGAGPAGIQAQLYERADGKYQITAVDGQGVSLGDENVGLTRQEALERVQRLGVKLDSLNTEGVSQATMEEIVAQEEMDNVDNLPVPEFVALQKKDSIESFVNEVHQVERNAGIDDVYMTEGELIVDAMADSDAAMQTYPKLMLLRMGAALRNATKQGRAARANELMSELNKMGVAMEEIVAIQNATDEQYEAFMHATAKQVAAGMNQFTSQFSAAARVTFKNGENSDIMSEAAMTEMEQAPTVAPQMKDPNAKFYGPVYKGKALSGKTLKDINSGNLRSALINLRTNASPVVKAILDKVLGLNLATKVIVAPVEGAGGSYDPVTDTITLDPASGLNQHTVLHEVIHAAVSKILRDPNSPLTQRFTEFFGQIKGRMGDAYGGQNLQEFAAEVIANPEFQALLKTIKAPKSESFLKNIWQSIARLFFKRSAFDVGVKFVNDVLDISDGVPAHAGDVLFYGSGNPDSTVGKVVKGTPAFATKQINKLRVGVENAAGFGVQKAAFGLLRLDNIFKMYPKILSGIKQITNATELRQGEQDRRVKKYNDSYNIMHKTYAKHPKDMDKLFDLAIDFRLEGIDVLNPAKALKPGDPNYNKTQQYAALPKDVRAVYEVMRKDFDGAFNEYVELLHEANPTMDKKTLKEEFMRSVPTIAYVPFMRYGDFWLEYQENGERVVESYESITERERKVKSLPASANPQIHENLSAIAYSAETVPPTQFIGKSLAGIIDNAPKGPNGETLPETNAQVQALYQAYLQLFPATSIMQNMQKSDAVRGMSKDLARGYSTVMIKWARQLPNARYLPAIQKGLAEVAKQGREARQAGHNGAAAAAASITTPTSMDFITNPTYGGLTRQLSAWSFGLYLGGNISSALVNLTSIALMTLPMLAGRYGYGDTMSALNRAGVEALKDLRKGQTWGEGRYKKLYETLQDHGQLQHTLAREILQGANASADEVNSWYAKMMNFVSIPFSETEKYNRAVTAIASYELARKNGETEAAAIQFALDTVKEVNTSGMAATGPKVMQNDIGRVMLTFKSFIWNSAAVIALAMKESFTALSPQDRAIARRQVMGMFGMSGAIAGVGGLPFFGAYATLATMVQALMGDDEDELNPKEQARLFFGELAYKGPVNYLTNLEIANRASLANNLAFRDDPQGIAQEGYVATAFKQALGPMGSFAFGLERGAAAMSRGEIMRGVEAWLPTSLRNLLKSSRYATEGATTLNGVAVDDDINAWNILMQTVGFAPADLSSIYEQRNSASRVNNAVLAKKTKLLNRMEFARRTNDRKLLTETKKELRDFGRRYPGLVNATTVERSYKARERAEREMIRGMRFNRYLEGELREQFFQD